MSRLRYLAYPLALTLALAPLAGAQSSIPSVPNQPGVSDYLQDDVPQRTPIRTDYPEIKGLPDGVSVDRVEWITDRRIAVFIKSAAMPGEPVQVQMLLARDWYSNPSKTYPEVWALDGLRALDTENGWTINTNIEQMFADKNVNVILPVGGESSFYSDWFEPNNGKNYKWESFLTQELPAVLKQGYRSNGQRAVTGISMGGTAAMNLAERRPDLFNFVGSFSGYLDTTSPGMPLAIRGALSDAGGYDATAMWGPDGSQQWIDHDPKLGLDALKGKTVYVSSGSGKDDFGQPDSVANGPANPAGVGLEVISRMTTQTFVDRANQAGLEVVSQFRPSGIHAWPYWQFEMTQAWPYIADSLGLSKEDRGADCATVGAIAEATASGDYGSCTVNEYDVKGGKAQDFRRGRAYWSPETGAHVLFGRIGAAYAEAGGPDSWLGFPVTGEQATPDGVGRYVHFQNGSIYWTPETDAQAVPKDMVDAWAEIGWEAGDLGYPVGAPKEMGGKLVQQFQRGYIVRNGDKAYWVRGEIAKKYGLVDTVNSKLGAPVGNEELINGGALQRFEQGSIYWSPKTGANMIFNGDIRDAWGRAGWENGKYGFPAKDQESIPAGGEKVVFEHGTISQVNGNIVEK
ncbi:alpha/beta hydrolase-fold protein [Corynebacterium pyruviciproducens]|uniref:alpha/beta hydrolase-fold protein n=1 Tax=Corynebacterium pyruviciproducens TaxID=598660 RepID=UPI002889AA85|nr:alpha/beta hydrolase-fold protein [Corynebacterium pyruviciproducens]